MVKSALLIARSTTRLVTPSSGLTTGLYKQEDKGLRSTGFSALRPDQDKGRPPDKPPSTATPAQTTKRPSTIPTRSGATSVGRPKAAVSPELARPGSRRKEKTPPTAPPTARGGTASRGQNYVPAEEKAAGRYVLQTALAPESPGPSAPYPLADAIKTGAAALHSLAGSGNREEDGTPPITPPTSRSGNAPIGRSRGSAAVKAAGELTKRSPAIVALKSRGHSGLCARVGGASGTGHGAEAQHTLVGPGRRREEETPPTTPPMNRSDTTTADERRQNASRTLRYDAAPFTPQLCPLVTQSHRATSPEGPLAKPDGASQIKCYVQNASIQRHGSCINQGEGNSIAGTAYPFPSTEGVTAAEKPPTESAIDNMLKGFCDIVNKKLDDFSLTMEKWSLHFANLPGSKPSSTDIASESYIKDALTSIAESPDSSSFVSSPGSSLCDYSSSSQNSFAPSINSSDSSTDDFLPGDFDLPYSDLSPTPPVPTSLLENLQRDKDSLKRNLAGLEDHKRKSNVKIRGVSESVKPPHLKEYIHNMISQLIPDISEHNIIERVYRIKRPVSLPQEVPRDIIVSFFPAWIRGKLFNLSSEKNFLLSPYGHLTFFRDLSKDTLKKRRDFSSVTRELRRSHFAYSWSPSSTLMPTKPNPRFRAFKLDKIQAAEAPFSITPAHQAMFRGFSFFN
ncbi:uncharacterized protein [Ranitomeya imitator]|uniref:uncharacterized protein n=1 Tax=Ranitomeya imitator TaxID=111125 RepID=UPI0037E7E827